MEPIKNGKELEGIINKIYSVLEKANATVSKNTDFREMGGKIEGYSALKVIFDSTVESSIKKSFDSILEKTGVKEKIEEENLNYVYRIKHNSEKNLKLGELCFVLEANKGDYDRMTDPELSNDEVDGFLERKTPMELFEEEKDEYRRHF